MPLTQNFKFAHAADLHLDSPLLGLEAFENAPVATIRDATREALKRLVDLCLDEKVDFLLIAGDIYDGDWKSLATGRFFADQMVRLAKAEIQVFLIKGNHDAASLISREVTLPGAHTFDHRKPETVLLENLGIAIHGQSFKDREVREDLSLAYPAPRPGFFNIGMLHTCGTGGSKLHEPYAPCTVDGLVRKGYDYWALGHVHQRALLNDDPPILFPGNVQGRHVREPAPEGKGATLVEVRNGRIASMVHVQLDVVRWMHIEIDVTGASTKEDALVRVCDKVRSASQECGGCLLAARLTVTGRCAASLPIHKDLTAFDSDLRSYVQGAVSDVWLEDIVVRVRSDALEPAPAGGSLGDVLEFVRTSHANGKLAEALSRAVALRERIRSSAPELIAEIDLEGDSILSELLPDVEEAILSLAVGAEK